MNPLSSRSRIGNSNEEQAIQEKQDQPEGQQPASMFHTPINRPVNSGNSSGSESSGYFLASSPGSDKISLSVKKVNSSSIPGSLKKAKIKEKPDAETSIDINGSEYEANEDKLITVK